MTGSFVPALFWTPRRMGESSGAAAAAVRNSRRVVFMAASIAQVRPADQPDFPLLDVFRFWRGLLRDDRGQAEGRVEIGRALQPDIHEQLAGGLDGNLGENLPGSGGSRAFEQPAVDPQVEGRASLFPCHLQLKAPGLGVDDPDPDDG